MLSNSQSRLAESLQLEDASNEEDLGLSIVALLTTAQDDAPEIPLSRIAHQIAQFDAASLLDPLNTVPILLPCKDPAAREILSLIGECGSAKEMIVALQEATEHLVVALDADDDEQQDSTHLSIANQLAILIELYSICIPRLKFKRKAPSETLKPLLLQLEDVIRQSAQFASPEEGRSLIDSVSQLVVRSSAWAGTSDEKESKQCQILLRSLLDCTIIACEPYVQSSLTQRNLESFYPRLAFRSAVLSDWEAGENVVSQMIEAYASIGVAPESVLNEPKLPIMLLYAHSKQSTPVSAHLSKLAPIIVSSIQSNWGIDESLSLLLRGLDPSKPSPRAFLTEDIIHPLFGVIPHLSSSHPDPLIRHQSFRILSLLLASTPPLLRLQLLRELTIDETYPQMRVAAVGLVKEAVLEGLLHPPNIFASPKFFDVFGTILFRPMPSDLLSNDGLSMKEFQESSESARVVECLGTYYTILVRDTENLTHLRNKDAIGSVDSGLLIPLRRALTRWEKEEQGLRGHGHFTLLGSLQMSLERVDEAISQLKT